MQERLLEQERALEQLSSRLAEVEQLPGYRSFLAVSRQLEQATAAGERGITWVRLGLTWILSTLYQVTAGAGNSCRGAGNHLGQAGTHLDTLHSVPGNSLGRQQLRGRGG
jgi:hypothetical protein